MKRHWACLLHAAVLIVLIGVFLHWALPQVSHLPYVYDEADYMFVATQSPAANYLDRPSQTLAQFIGMGLSQRGNPSERGSLSELIRTSGDMNFYRHWHGPLYFFWLGAVAKAEHAEADRNGERTRSFAMRRWFVVFPLVTVFAIYFGALWIFPAPTDIPAAVASSALYLWSYPLGRSTELAPHSMYALWFTLALLLLAKLMTTPAAGGNVLRPRRYWYAAVAVAALAFVTMELSLTLLVTLAVVAWCERRKLRPDKAWAIRSVLLFLGIAAALWPIGLLRFNFLKSYLFMAYLALFRHNAWGDVSLRETWRLRLAGSPVEWLLIAVALILFRYRRDRAAFPALVYSLLTFAALFRVNTDTPRYLLPLLPGFLLFTGFVLAERISSWSPSLRAAAVVCLVALLWANTARQMAAYPPHSAGRDPRMQAMLASVPENHLQDQPLLVPAQDLPTLHYYFPQSVTRSYATPAPPAGPSDLSEATLLRGYPVRWRMPQPAAK